MIMIIIIFIFIFIFTRQFVNLNVNVLQRSARLKILLIKLLIIYIVTFNNFID
jgi:hypothetical protein